ncbi:hypothetical protein GKODMF_14050 [Candidatus Electrothrix gigas]
MKSYVFGIGMTVLLLCFTSSVSAELLGMSSIREIETVRVTTQTVVKSWTSQYKISVRVKNKTRIKLSSRMLRQAMLNNAVAGDFVTTVRRGGRIERKHLRGCRNISSELSGSIRYFRTGQFQRVRTVLVRVQEITRVQPRPLRLAVVLKRFQKIKTELPATVKLKGSMKEVTEKVDKAGSKGSSGSDDDGSKGSSGSDDDGSKGSSGSDDDGSKGSSGSDDGGSKGSSGSDDGGSGGTTPPETPVSCMDNPQSCADKLNIDVTQLTKITDVRKINWSVISQTTVNWSVIKVVENINWDIRIDSSGIIDFKGMECTGDPGMSCYTCYNGILASLAGIPCDDGRSNTENDTCSSSGICVGQPVLSPIVPPNPPY